MRYRADLRTFLFIACYFGITATLWTLPAGVPWGAKVPLLVLTCWFSFFCAVATHNTVHSPVSVSYTHLTLPTNREV